jgi:LmbE family N-acetylglucosaminyl deacetylase
MLIRIINIVFSSRLNSIKRGKIMTNRYFQTDFRKPTILAVFAHPDDETFLVGGTLAHYARNGARVELLCLTEGEGGANALAGAKGKLALSLIRRMELEQCCEVLGINLVGVRHYPDGGLAAVNPRELALVIGRAIAHRRPDVVLTFGSEGLTGHPDHLAIHRATTLAFEWSAKAGSVLFYSGLPEQIINRLSSRMEGWLGNLKLGLKGQPAEQLPVAVDITQTARLKWEALNCHRSQIGSFSGLSHSDKELMGQREFFRPVMVAGTAWQANYREYSSLLR